MKTSFKFFFLLLMTLALLVGCNKSDDDSTPVIDLTITNIMPMVGETGTEVTIFGQGFDPKDMTNNIVSFNGIPAIVSMATSTQIQTTVPTGASTGPISVAVDGMTESGPIFTYDERLKFVGDYENDNYEARYNRPGSIDTILPVNGISEIEIKLVSNSTDEIEVDIREFLEEGINDMIGVNNLVFTFDDDIIAQVNGDEFEIEDFDFLITENGTTTVPCSFDEGEGVLENGEILFSFRYTVQAEIPFSISAEDVELELQ